MMRHCGDCQLCCKLLPVPPLQKKAGQKCQHQKFGKGCAVYHTRAMPPECSLWNCRWLVNDDTDDLSRPDRAHYVIDIMPDYITLSHDDSGDKRHLQVLQIWVDPKHPDAWRQDKALLAYLVRRAQNNIAALIRFDAQRAITVFAPPFAEDGQWHEKTSDAPSEKTHTLDQVLQALGEA